MKKITLSFLSISLMISVFGQDFNKPETVGHKPKMDNAVKPLFVLQADDKTVTLEEKLQSSVLEAIDPNQIETIEVLKDSNAISKYGEAARNGVILIRFRDYKSLHFRTKELFEKFEPAKDSIKK